MNKICIIGLGNMGSAIANSLKDLEIVKCEKQDNPNEKLQDCEAFIIAVKPQSFAELAESVNIDLSDKLAISIMAGVSISKIQEKLNMKKVVRSMPNLGVQIGKGITGWIASDEVSEEEKEFAKNIFSTMGENIELKDEKMIDSLAAISGSGPAYFFYLTELLQKKAEDLGFSPDDAKKMAEATFTGSAEIFAKGNKTAEEWREAVSSKGGSTVEAIKYMQENDFAEVFETAIDKAVERWKNFEIE